MELPLTPSARPRRASRRSSGGAYGTPPYEAEALTGRALLRDEPPYGTSLLTGRRRWDEPPYGPEAGALTGRDSLLDRSLIAGGAYGTSLLTGRRRLRDESLLTDGGAYGTSPLTGRASCAEALMDEPPYERIFFTGPRRLRRRRLRDKPPYTGGGGLRDGGPGKSLLTGRRRRRLRDEPYRTER